MFAPRPFELVASATSALLGSVRVRGACIVAAQAIVPIRPARSFTSPTPSGCSRLPRKITYKSSSGSIHIAVPVNPPWPNAASLISSPRLRE